MQLVGISVSNLKEISSKEKFLWLNAKSFLLSGFVPFIPLARKTPSFRAEM